MGERVRPYMFYDVAITICSVCFRKLEGKIVFENDNVFLLKRCPEHGAERVLIADDVDYYRKCREVFIKKPEMPLVYNTPVKWGCPYDCGLCTDHEQHSCLSLIEVTDSCNLRCPVCYASSGPERVQHRSLALIEKMFDAVVRNEGHPDVVQISGGEPTVHPDFFEIIELAKARPIQHLMINTNGVRVAQHQRSYDRSRQILDLEHYLDVLEQKPGALRGSKPLAEWRAQGRWPESYDRLWERMAGKQGRQAGARAMVAVIRMGREFGHAKLEAAVVDALSLGCTDVAAIRHLLMADQLMHAAQATIEIGALAAYERPLPTMIEYNQLLSAGITAGTSGVQA